MKPSLRPVIEYLEKISREDYTGLVRLHFNRGGVSSVTQEIRMRLDIEQTERGHEEGAEP